MKTPMRQMFEYLVKNAEASHAEKLAEAVRLLEVEKKHIIMAASRTFPEIVGYEIGEEYYNNIYASKIKIDNEPEIIIGVNLETNSIGVQLNSEASKTPPLAAKEAQAKTNTNDMQSNDEPSAP